MKDWKKILITVATPIREAIKVIDEGALQIALVVDGEQRLLGTVTDGDVRRGILKNISLESPVERIMNPSPTVARATDSRSETLALLQRKNLHHVPIVDADRRVVGLEILDALLEPRVRENLVVIMAGGLGSRLRPLTDDCPKPMLKVGGKPILETILESFLKDGFGRFCFAVNYKAEMIEKHFGDGAKFGCEIRYIHEDEPLGTAGALCLLEESLEQALIVINGDVLTKVDFGALVDSHVRKNSFATMCVREYDMQVPYGVVIAENEQFKSIEEKPVQKFFVNAGIYVLDPKAVEMVPRRTRFDMTELFRLIETQGHKASIFPVMEYWLDLGRVDDLRRAQETFGDVFG